MCRRPYCLNLSMKFTRYLFKFVSFVCGRIPYVHKEEIYHHNYPQNFLLGPIVLYNHLKFITDDYSYAYLVRIIIQLCVFKL